MRIWILISFLLSAIYTFSQKRMSNDSLRILFHQIENEADLDRVLNFSNDTINTTSQAYLGSMTVMKAEYAFLPTKKYSYFKEGTTILENSIKDTKSVEKIYLRLLIQLNTPQFLAYYENITQDVNFIVNNIGRSQLPKDWKIVFLEDIILLENDNYDFSELKKQLAKCKES